MRPQQSHLLWRRTLRCEDKNSGYDENTDCDIKPKKAFSFSQLFSDKTNKKLREEIDKDIQAKIEADRIESKAKELKEKELEQLNRMVYGDSKGESVSDSVIKEDLDE